MAEPLMHFFAFGLNHHAASLEQRDAFVLQEADVRALYRTLECSPRAEFVLVSTCNRTECYLHGTEADVERIKAGISLCAGETWPASEIAFLLRDEEAVQHILEVTAGLNSMVLGDGQILSQVKEAYRLAVEEERVAAVLHRLLHTAFAAAKRVVHETKISSGQASVAGTAASIVSEALAEHVDAEGSADVLVVGAGQMGRLVIESLSRDNRIRLALTNRSCERVDEIVSQHPGVEMVPWGERYGELLKSNAVIVATSAEDYLVTAEGLEGKDLAQEILFVDLAIPRNVDPVIEDMSGCRVYDLDTLQRMIQGVIDLRKTDIEPARQICDEMLADFVSWFFHHQALQPAIHAILETFDGIRQQEIVRHQHRFAEADYRQLDRITKSIMQKVLSVPVVRLKNVGPDHIDYVNGIKLLQLLFGREACEDPVASLSDLSDTMLEVIAEPERASLSTLAACPFDERPASEIQEAPGSRAITRSALTLGTRKSALALWQATHVQAALESAGCRTELRKISTRGDRILDKPLSQIDGKSLFTKELDLAILDGRIDFAVHSLKDLPSTLPDGLILAAVTVRETPFDAFVAHPSFDGTLDELPEGARIGTSSLRRTAQLLAWRPDLEIVPVRGNVDSRIAKLDESDWHGVVLAAAGLIRLGLEDRIHTTFELAVMLPAVGQGALGIVCAESNTTVHHILRAVLHDEETTASVASERAFLRCLEGSCRVPVGALASRDDAGRLVLDGFVASIDGSRVIRDTEMVDPRHPETAGISLAQRLLDRGAEALLVDWLTG